jgi:hypothetical protein
MGIFMRQGGNRGSCRAGLAAGLGALALVFAAEAEAGSKVYSPHVEKGELEIENRGLVTNDRDPAKDGELKMKTGLGYGINDWWFAEAYAITSRAPGGSPFGLDGVEFESLFQLTPQGRYWADFGALVEYSVATKDHAPDELEFTAIAEKDIGRTTHTANVTFVKELGSHAEDVALEYAWASRWRLSPYFQPGFEAFGEIGEVKDVEPLAGQEHQLGPAIIGTIPIGFAPGKLHYEAAYLFGLTAGSPGGAFRWLLEYELHF